jgi:hypothetical protein
MVSGCQGDIRRRETHRMARFFIGFEGSGLERLLDDEIEEVILQAIEIIDDEFAEEIAGRIARVDHGGPKTFSDQYLPRVYRSWYSVRLVRRLHICFVQVVARLATDTWVGLACRGEEFVLHAILDQARAVAEIVEKPAQFMEKLERSLTELAEIAFDDYDFLFAFDPAADGIDDPTTDHGHQFGMAAPLHPRSWFDPIGQLPVHPLVSSWAEEGENA